ncbi:hypothetical protein [Aquipseudomonas ullengensis]|uniref:Uncharacterized protein n=1 Tax=Aquipseudomonas ullengensis TaxID=2759166 RepID=A0A7W4QBM3_9GAMM|nr:hypothetical protein [Pseudomonas ullengensis]MBB2497087.1 hypothetical protein [Pseudomonas ullengensis]
MAFSLLPDPLQLCRDALNKLENGINGIATRKMESSEFAQALNRYSRISLGMQYVVEKSLACCFERLDLPSRTEISTLAAAVQRVEDKLDQLLPVVSPAALEPKPPRTRRPLDIAPEQALSEARARVQKPAAKSTGQEQ